METFGQNGESLQRRTLAAFLALTEATRDWTRRLVMLEASGEAAPFALAVVVAGGAVLWTCADEALLRESGLAGLTDFQVTTLSEALRVLKNELRKGLPVSVGVLDAGHGVWREAVKRGLQPDAVFAGLQNADAAAMLRERGAGRLEMVSGAGLQEHRAATWRERKAADDEMLARFGKIGEPERAVAAQWIRSAARLFPRDTFRCYATAWDASKDGR